jgi:hypothetical protein
MRQHNLDENSLITVANPPYSPDLAPSDSWFFGHIKASLASHIFNDINELLEGVIELLNEVQPSELQLVFTAGSNERNRA